MEPGPGARRAGRALGALAHSLPEPRRDSHADLARRGRQARAGGPGPGTLPGPARRGRRDGAGHVSASGAQLSRARPPARPAGAGRGVVRAVSWMSAEWEREPSVILSSRVATRDLVGGRS